MIRQDDGSPVLERRSTDDVADTSGCSSFHIIGVGASAGGLESLETLFDHVPSDKWPSNVASRL